MCFLIFYALLCSASAAVIAVVAAAAAPFLHVAPVAFSELPMFKFYGQVYKFELLAHAVVSMSVCFGGLTACQDDFTLNFNFFVIGFISRVALTKSI